MTKKSKSSVSDAFELKEKVNGITDSDVRVEVEVSKYGDSARTYFTCNNRVYDEERDGYFYHVIPDDEIGDLDFKGQDVMINDVSRHCHDFVIGEDGHIIIFVANEG